MATLDQDDLFRCAPLTRVPLGSSVDLVYLALRDTAQLVSSSGVSSACSCSRFRSLREHADRLARMERTSEREALLHLARLAEQGLLVSRAELFSCLETCQERDPASEISCLAVPTSNRPTELRRALCSYASNFLRHGRKPALLVCDDSASADQRRLSQEILAGVTVDSNFSSCYVGVAQKRGLIDRLTDGGDVPRQIAEFALCPEGDLPTTGANRNAIQLYTAGEMIISVDDDTICRPCAAPGGNAADRLSLGGDSNPTEFWFFPDYGAALAAAQFTEFDVAGRHEQLLGRHLRSVVRDAARKSRLDLGGLCDHLLLSIWSGQGRILVTANGCVGDSGMYSGAGLRRHRGVGTRQRLTASEPEYRMALKSRQVIGQSPAATVCHGVPFTTMFVGLDNRQLLPPFLPVCRNQDGVFACSLDRCVPDAYFGYLPWSLVHGPAAHPDYCQGAAEDMRLSNIIISLMSLWKPPSQDSAPDRLMQSLGTHLSEIARAASRDFHHLLRSLAWNRASHIIRRTEALIKQFENSPSYWASDLQADIEAFREAATGPDFGLPSDLPEEGGRATRLQLTQTLVRLFGELLFWWPAIVERAKALRANNDLPALSVR